MNRARRRLLVALAGIGGAAAAAERTLALPGVEAVRFDAAGELSVTQGEHERLTIEAEPAVLERIVAEVGGGELRIGFRPGAEVRTQRPIRFRIELRRLGRLLVRGSTRAELGALTVQRLALSIDGSAEVHCARLQAQHLELDVGGSADVAIAAGEVATQRIAIAGSGRYAAPALASRSAEVAIDGSGDVHLAAAERLAVRIAGSGDVRYRGEPQLVEQISGAGRVRRER